MENINKNKIIFSSDNRQNLSILNRNNEENSFIKTDSPSISKVNSKHMLSPTTDLRNKSNTSNYNTSSEAQQKEEPKKFSTVFRYEDVDSNMDLIKLRHTRESTLNKSHSIIKGNLNNEDKYFEINNRRKLENQKKQGHDTLLPPQQPSQQVINILNTINSQNKGQNIIQDPNNRRPSQRNAYNQVYNNNLNNYVKNYNKTKNKHSASLDYKFQVNFLAKNRLNVSLAKNNEDLQAKESNKNKANNSIKYLHSDSVYNNRFFPKNSINMDVNSSNQVFNYLKNSNSNLKKSLNSLISNKSEMENSFYSRNSSKYNESPFNNNFLMKIKNQKRIYDENIQKGLINSPNNEEENSGKLKSPNQNLTINYEAGIKDNISINSGHISNVSKNNMNHCNKNIFHYPNSIKPKKMFLKDEKNDIENNLMTNMQEYLFEHAHSQNEMQNNKRSIPLIINFILIFF